MLIVLVRFVLKAGSTEYRVLSTEYCVLSIATKSAIFSQSSPNVCSIRKLHLHTRPTRSQAQAQHLAHAKNSLLRHRMADRADAVFILVEHLVRPPSLRPANDRISSRRQEAAPHSARSGSIGRSHDPQRCQCQAVVSRPDSPRR